MARTERITLGSDELVIAPLGAEVAGDLWDDIVAALKDELRAELDGIGAKLEVFRGVDLESDSAKRALLATFAPTALRLLTTVPKALQQRWRKLFAEQTTVRTGSVDLNMASAKLYDGMFAGRLADRYRWELAHLKLNYFTFLPSKPKSENSEAGG